MSEMVNVKLPRRKVEQLANGDHDGFEEPEVYFAAAQAALQEPSGVVRLEGEIVAKRNPDGETEHHAELGDEIVFAATPQAIPITGPVAIEITPAKEKGE